ncbi:MAG: MoaD/ThiS family protein [Chloroflexi bacterium]|nr:MoaD/ThiS family protein [Chloroflexota bacterium]
MAVDQRKLTQSRRLRVTVRLFAALREAVGQGQIALELPAGARVDDVTHYLADLYPSVETLLLTAAVARNREPAAGDAWLAEGDEVAFLPPVGGG